MIASRYFFIGVEFFVAILLVHLFNSLIEANLLEFDAR